MIISRANGADGSKAKLIAGQTGAITPGLPSLLGIAYRMLSSRADTEDGAALPAGLAGVGAISTESPASAQLQQPLLDRRPGVGIVLAQPHGQARQVVEDEQLNAFERYDRHSVRFKPPAL